MVRSLLGEERRGAFLKSLSTWGRKAVEKSIHLKYVVLMGIDLFKCSNPHVFLLAPLASSLASVLLRPDRNSRELSWRVEAAQQGQQLRLQAQEVIATTLRRNDEHRNSFNYYSQTIANPMDGGRAVFCCRHLPLF